MRKHAMNTANQADDGPAQDFSKKNTKSTKKKKIATTPWSNGTNAW